MCAARQIPMMGVVPPRGGARSEQSDRGRRISPRASRAGVFHRSPRKKGTLMNDNAADQSPRPHGRYLTRRTALGRLLGMGAGATLVTAALGAFPATVRGLSAVSEPSGA